MKKLRVAHYAQIPCQPFCVDVKDEEQAKFICDVLANQHLFLFEQGIIPDYCNVITVQQQNDEEETWEDYFNEDSEMDWGEYEYTYLSKEKEQNHSEKMLNDLDSESNNSILTFNI